MQFIGIIPARYASSRFPGKPLVDIGGKSMIQRVYEQAYKCGLLAEVVVATDDKRIHEHVLAFGNAVMTGNQHSTGTDRCAEAFSIINQHGKYTKADGLINIQGDEPFIAPKQIELLIHALSDPAKQIVTLIKKIRTEADLSNPNIVKVVTAINGKALYFSRAPIPHARNPVSIQNQEPGYGYMHIGLYGFRISTLEEIVKMPAGLLETTESLEQLRWLEHGADIHVVETQSAGISIDTPEDLERIKELM